MDALRKARRAIIRWWTSRCIWQARPRVFDPLLGQPVDGDINAIVHGLTDMSPKPWADRMREIQAAGGGIEIKSFRLTQANAVVVGAGTLGLSPEGKLNGVVRVAIVGIEQIVPQLGIDRMIGQGIDQLSGGKRHARPAGTWVERDHSRGPRTQA